MLTALFLRRIQSETRKFPMMSIVSETFLRSCFVKVFPWNTHGQGRVLREHDGQREDDEDYRASRFAAALLMPRKLLTESIRETWKPSLPHQSDDSEMMELLSTVGTTFAVGLGVVLTAYALGATRRR